jgi:hypothetical protein
MSVDAVQLTVAEFGADELAVTLEGVVGLVASGVATLRVDLVSFALWTDSLPAASDAVIW